LRQSFVEEFMAKYISMKLERVVATKTFM